MQAKEKGLIDEFGGLNKAVEIAKQLENLPADKDVKRVVFPTPKPFFQELFGSDDEATVQAKQREALMQALPEDARRLFRYAALFDAMKRGETMALMPFELNIK